METGFSEPIEVARVQLPTPLPFYTLASPLGGQGLHALHDALNVHRRSVALLSARCIARTTYW